MAVFKIKEIHFEIVSYTIIGISIIIAFLIIGGVEVGPFTQFNE